MKLLRSLCALVVFFGACTVGQIGQAAFHDWRIKEIFTNHDGTVQFIEFFTTSAGENFLNGHSIGATSDGNLVTYTFPNQSLSGSTASKHFLLATSGFSALAGGVAPDYVTAPLPSNFFKPNAASISINFANGFDVATFAGSLLPKDGVNSLTDTVLGIFGDTDNFVTGVNTPTNFASVTGSVNVPPPSNPSDFNGDGVVNGLDLAAWQGGFGATGSAATKSAGNADADGDVDGADFLKWQSQVGSPAAVAVPEPASCALALAASLLLASARRGGRVARWRFACRMR